MKKAKNVHSIKTLEQEIYRLKLEARHIEQQLDRNLDHLQENYWSMMMNSFRCGDDKKKNGESNFWKNFFKHDGFNAAVDTIAGNVADKATEGLQNWMNNFLGKNKH